MTKYKYYFRKPRSEIVKDILSYLAIAGLTSVAATSPYFVSNLMKGVNKWFKNKKYKNEGKRVYNAFYKLRREGCIDIKIKNHQLYISLTEKGKRKANWLQIDALKIKEPKKWDGKWRLIMFDISQIKKTYREVFRGKLKELGFYPFQKSVWIHPFDCRDEIELLKEFFGFSDKELSLIIAESIGPDKGFKKIFKLN
jgi:DNA-binding transcriptional regulator PaaX